MTNPYISHETNPELLAPLPIQHDLYPSNEGPNERPKCGALQVEACSR